MRPGEECEEDALITKGSLLGCLSERFDLIDLM